MEKTVKQPGKSEKRFGGFMTPGRAIVEVLENSLRILEFEGSKPELRAFFTLDLKGKSDEDLTADLTRIFKNISAKKNLTLVVNRRQVLLKNLTLPSQKVAEVKKMAALQIASQTPFSKEESVWDYLPVAENSDGSSSILAVAVEKKRIERFLKLIQAVGGRVADVKFSSFFIWRLYQKTKNLFPGEDSKPVLIVFSDEDHMELCFCDRDHLYYSRYLPVGEDQIVVKNMPEILNQITLTTHSYDREKWGPSVHGVVFISSREEAPLIEKISDVLGKPTVYFDPIKSVTVRKNLAAHQAQKVFWGTGLGMLIKDPSPFNLIPSTFKKDNEPNQNVGKLIGLAALFFIFFLVAVVWQGIENYKRSQSLKEVEETNEQLMGQVKEIQEKKRQFDMLKDKKQNILIVDVIRDLYHLTPMDAAYTSIEIKPPGQVVLKGEVQSDASLRQLESSLTAAEFFTDVKLIEGPSPNAGAPDVRKSFSITANLKSATEPPVKEKP